MCVLNAYNHYSYSGTWKGLPEAAVTGVNVGALIFVSVCTAPGVINTLFSPWAAVCAHSSAAALD